MKAEEKKKNFARELLKMCQNDVTSYRINGIAIDSLRVFYSVLGIVVGFDCIGNLYETQTSFTHHKALWWSALRDVSRVQRISMN